VLVGQQPPGDGKPLVGLWAHRRTDAAGDAGDADAAPGVAMRADAHALVTHLRRVTPYEAVLHLACALRCFPLCDCLRAT
jgi:hypothetical protein